jgi:hypothetical protein
VDRFALAVSRVKTKAHQLYYIWTERELGVEPVGSAGLAVSSGADQTSISAVRTAVPVGVRVDAWADQLPFIAVAAKTDFAACRRSRQSHYMQLSA